MNKKKGKKKKRKKKERSREIREKDISQGKVIAKYEKMITKFQICHMKKLKKIPGYRKFYQRYS